MKKTKDGLYTSAWWILKIKKKIEYNFFIGKIELIPMNLQRSLFIIEIQKKKI